MGIFFGRLKNESVKDGKKLRKNEKLPDPPPVHIGTPEGAVEDADLKKMKWQLKNDIDSFLLNNILMSVQFFGNYAREITDYKGIIISERERMLNMSLNKHNKHVLLPDRLHEMIHKRVRFRMKHGRRKNIQEPLHPLRMLVVHENFEVNETEEDEYSFLLNEPVYRVLLEASSNPGYVQLKKLEVMQKEKAAIMKREIDTTSSSDEGKEIRHMEDLKLKLENMPHSTMRKNKPTNLAMSSASSSSGYGYAPMSPNSEQNEIKRPSILKTKTNFLQKHKPGAPKPRPKSPVTPKTDSGNELESGYHPSDSDTDYGYATITALTTPRPLKDLPSGEVLISSVELPDSCFMPVKVKNHNIPTDPLISVHNYLISKKFMEYFTDLFKDRLAGSLDFSNEIVNSATSQGATIYCNVYKDDICQAKFEIIPTMKSIWPTVAKEYLNRKRNVVKNEKTNIIYEWPTRRMVKRIESFGCHIVPTGYMPTRGLNQNGDLEWQLAFPSAERFLESCLSHEQIRTYLFTLLLFKSFVEPSLSKLGVESEHIRTHLFWECERNSGAWREDRLGEKLLIFLRDLYGHIQSGKLPDYFMRKRNLFQSIPRRTLFGVQGQLYRIIESPVLHLISALRNLKYAESNFYPLPNFLELYRILVDKNPISIINPNMPSEESPPIIEEDISDNENIYSDLEDTERLWKKKNFEKQLAKKALKAQAEAKIVYTDPVDFTNMIYKSETEHHVHSMRLRLIFKFFIPHFIEMSKKSYNFKDTKQALLYLAQAERLNVLLLEEAGEIETRTYASSISYLKKQILENKDVGNPPLPMRVTIKNNNNIYRKKVAQSFPFSHQPEKITNIESIACETKDEAKVRIESPNNSFRKEKVAVEIHREQNGIAVDKYTEENSEDSDGPSTDL